MARKPKKSSGQHTPSPLSLPPEGNCTGGCTGGCTGAATGALGQLSHVFLQVSFAPSSLEHSLSLFLLLDNKAALVGVFATVGKREADNAFAVM